MARKRQRAKDRKQKLHRENIPGSLDHASGEVEGVEAAIVAGADGKPVEPLPDDVAAEPDDAVQSDGIRGCGGHDVISFGLRVRMNLLFYRIQLLNERNQPTRTLALEFEADRNTVAEDRSLLLNETEIPSIRTL